MERIGGGICFCAADASHENIHCVVPLGFEKDFKVFGFPEWGQECLDPWKNSYTRLYNRAESKRNGKPVEKSAEAESEEGED